MTWRLTGDKSLPGQCWPGCLTPWHQYAKITRWCDTWRRLSFDYIHHLLSISISATMANVGNLDRIAHLNSMLSTWICRVLIVSGYLRVSKWDIAKFRRCDIACQNVHITKLSWRAMWHWYYWDGCQISEWLKRCEHKSRDFVRSKGRIALGYSWDASKGLRHHDCCRCPGAK